jgi:dTDP-4-dehydrorhamnose 3,5-epimerase
VSRDFIVLFVPTELSGAWLIEPEFRSDERGGFARTWCRREFEVRGLNPNLAQCNISINRLRGTVRGMHFQRAPHAEAKLVRCTRGAIHDVIVDLRRDSSTYRRSIACELSGENHRQLYIPEGFAHGFQTLTDDSEVFYQMSREYHADSSTGVRWDDPSLTVRWPLSIACISEKDRSWPEWNDE